MRTEKTHIHSLCLEGFPTSLLCLANSYSFIKAQLNATTSLKSSPTLQVVERIFPAFVSTLHSRIPSSSSQQTVKERIPENKLEITGQ